MIKRDFRNDLKNGKLRAEDTIANLKPYMLENIPYAIPLNSSTELRKYFAVAIFKYSTTEDTFEEIMEQLHDESYEDQNSISNNDRIYYTISSSVQSISKIIGNFTADIREEGLAFNVGENMFFLSANRLKESFKSSIILLQNGFFVEVLPLFRLIHEQLCWLCYVLQEKDEKSLLKNRTQSNVKYLKNLLGDEQGQLYGKLSSEAHLEPKTIYKYLDIKDDKVYIKGRSGKKCSEEIPTLILLYQTFIQVLYHGFKKFNLSSKKMEYYKQFINCGLMVCENLYKSYHDKDRMLQFIDRI